MLDHSQRLTLLVDSGSPVTPPSSDSSELKLADSGVGTEISMYKGSEMCKHVSFASSAKAA